MSYWNIRQQRSCNLPNLTIFYRISPTEVIPKTSYMMPISDGYVALLLSVNLCTFYEFHACYNSSKSVTGQFRCATLELYNFGYQCSLGAPP